LVFIALFGYNRDLLSKEMKIFIVTIVFMIYFLKGSDCGCSFKFPTLKIFF